LDELLADSKKENQKGFSFACVLKPSITGHRTAKWITIDAIFAYSQVRALIDCLFTELAHGKPRHEPDFHTGDLEIM